jgi:carotenoid cleavage dioxygenase
MVHDMALTEHYVVLVLSPLFFDLDDALAGGSLLSWEPERGTRIALVPRDGGLVRWCEDDAFWMWHAAGAYERDDPAGGNPVVLDYVHWDRPRGLVPGDAHGHGVLARALLDPAAGTITRTVLADDAVEFPRVDDRRLTTRHGVVATAASGRSDVQGPDALCWFDPDTGTRTRWSAGDLAVGEVAFAPDPASDAPDSGWWLTFATDRRTGESRLLVIPAADPGTGPVAQVRLPVRVPLGLHGNWLPADAEVLP